MHQKNEIFNIGQIYGSMLNTVKTVQLNEKTASHNKMGKKAGPGDKNLPGYEGKNPKGTTDVGNKNSSGPENAEGYEQPTIDANKVKDKENNKEKQNLGGDVEKINREAINNFMSKKSIFDRLYNEMMGAGDELGAGPGADTPESDLEALGIGGEEPGMEGGEGEGEVTITLDRDLAQKLHDVLMGVLGGGEEHEAGESETEELGEHEGMEGGEGEGADEEDEQSFSFEEDEETLGTPVKDKVKGGDKLMGKSNKVDMALKVGPGKGGDGKYTDKVGQDGDHGHALHGAKVPKPAMKVDTKITSKTGEYMFAQK